MTAATPASPEVPATARARPRGFAAPGSRFFVGVGLFMLAVAVIGFARTFFFPVLTTGGGFPWLFVAHGIAFFGWMLLFVLQATLIKGGRRELHRFLGWASLPLAAAMVSTCIGVGVVLANRELAGGPDRDGIDGFAGVVTAMLLFALLYGAAIGTRRRPEAHKRFMLLATIAILWPAWFRFRHYFPDVPRPDIMFGLVANDALIGFAMIRDRLRFGRVHPVLLWAGTALVLEHVLESLLFGTSGWRAFSLLLLGA